MYYSQIYGISVKKKKEEERKKKKTYKPKSIKLFGYIVLMFA